MQPAPSQQGVSATRRVSGGIERTAAEYEDLLRAGGFRLARVITARSFTNVIEGIAEWT
jgi:hypothetical protein